ncbi:MAG: type II secretion system F family protein [Thermogutta sp.]
MTDFVAIAQLIALTPSLDWAKLLPFAAFGMFAILSFLLLETLAARKPRTAERLEELARPQIRRAPGEPAAIKRRDGLTRALEKATPALAKPLEPKSEIEKSKLKQRLAEAGFLGDAAAQIYLGLKFAGLVGGLAIGAAVFLGLWGVRQSSLVAATFFAGFLFYLPEIVLWYLAKRRKEAIFLSLPDALDLMVVCVEAGLGLDQAMRKVTEELGSSHPVIAKEFALANLQLQMGRPRSEVLHEMGARCGVPDVRSLAAVIIQAEKFGSSIAQALRVQSDSMRTRRRQLAEERAQKTAVKLIFPLVLFIFPGLFVVLVGPAAITMIRELFPMMAGAR